MGSGGEDPPLKSSNAGEVFHTQFVGEVLICSFQGRQRDKDVRLRYSYEMNHNEHDRDLIRMGPCVRPAKLSF